MREWQIHKEKNDHYVIVIEGRRVDVTCRMVPMQLAQGTIKKLPRWRWSLVDSGPLKQRIQSAERYDTWEDAAAGAEGWIRLDPKTRMVRRLDDLGAFQGGMENECENRGESS